MSSHIFYLSQHLQLYCLVLTTPARFFMRYLVISISSILSNSTMIKWLKVFLPSKLLMQTSDGVCAGCLVGKHPKKRYDFGKEHIDEYILNLIHSDVAGTILTNPINGCRYFLTFIDDCSRYCRVYFMQKNYKFLRLLKFLRLWLRIVSVRK